MDTIIYYSEMEGISLEHLKRSSGYDMRSNHFHNEYEIYFLTEGERLFFFNNRAYQVKKGSLILVDTNLIHMTHAPEDDTTGYTRIILYIDKFKMQQFDEKFPHLNLVHIVRREYAAGRGVPVVVAVEQDPRGDGWALTLAYAKALGALRAGAIKTTFKEETETDLFGEQNVLMGGVNKLVEMGFEVLTDAGYQPEIAYFEVCHELKMLVDLMNEGGLNKARWSCSDTAQYGDYVNTVINEDCRKRMEYHLQRIQDGSFAKEFIDDQDAGAPHFKELQEKYSNERIETVGPKLRAMFSWNKDGVKDADEANSFTGKIARAQVQ